MLHKSFRGHADIKSADEGLAEIVVSAYGNVDHDGDIVEKGAAAKQIAGEYGPNPKGFLDHSCSMLTAVAKTLQWWEEDDGLHIEAQYNLEKEIGRDAFSDLKFYGSDMEFSVGYGVKAVDHPTPLQKDAGARRVIKEWQINEWSHVWLGANSNTRLIGAKSIDDRLTEIERQLAAGIVTPAESKEAEQVPDPVVDPEAVTVDPLMVAKFRLLVASTRT